MALPTMDHRVFKAIQEIENPQDFHKLGKVKVGDMFLYGISIIEQKTKKEPGEVVTYYAVDKIDGPNMSFSQYHARLTK